MDDRLSSISHWGMFRDPFPVFIVPKGFEISEKDRAELMKPNGYICTYPFPPNSFMVLRN